MSSGNIVVVATFTVEPLRKGLDYWLRRLCIDQQLVFGPYGQIVQELLSGESELRRNSHGINVILIRVEDLVEGVPANAVERAVREHLCNFIRSLEVAIANSNSSYLVLLCPGSTSHEHEIRGSLADAESLLIQELSSRNVLHVTPAQMHQEYPVAEYEDRYRSRLAHIPFTDEMFSALATLIVRRIVALTYPPRKVLVLDCDNVLWEGVCGEQSPAELVLGTLATTVQQFAIQQRENGMLLCLCSKNNEVDVVRVFADRPDMPLAWTDFVARRINWEPKYLNIQSLADELGFALNAFIFLDDDSIECAAMRAYCPEVVTIQVSQNPDDLKRKLQNTWAFDRIRVTTEDKLRPVAYQQERLRKQLQSSSISLERFIEDLNIRLDIRPMSPNDSERISQLTFRTNQFNTSGVRRMPHEVAQYQAQRDQCCLAVAASDRFGEYGTVGTVFYVLTREALVVEAMLLSCRALGKRIEHKTLAWLQAVARDKGAAEVHFQFNPSEKNTPARTFLEEVSKSSSEGPNGRILYRCTSACEPPALAPDGILMVQN